MKIYNPNDWYWYVAGDTTRVFSSKAGDYVPLTDPTFLAWESDGSVPSISPSEADLGAALAPSLARPVSAVALDGYTGAQADLVLQHLMFKIAFNHENRIRACERALALNGSPAAMTPAQARATVKALM